MGFNVDEERPVMFLYGNPSNKKSQLETMIRISEAKVTEAKSKFPEGWTPREGVSAREARVSMNAEFGWPGHSYPVAKYKKMVLNNRDKSHFSHFDNLFVGAYTYNPVKHTPENFAAAEELEAECELEYAYDRYLSELKVLEGYRRLLRELSPQISFEGFLRENADELKRVRAAKRACSFRKNVPFRMVSTKLDNAYRAAKAEYIAAYARFYDIVVSEFGEEAEKRNSLTDYFIG